MARRKNVLSAEDLAPSASPVYVIDDFESAVDLFIRDGKIRNLSKHTLDFYRRELNVFRIILERQRVSTNPTDITENILKNNVILYLMEEGQKETSINCVLRAVRTLLNFLVKEGYLVESPMKRVHLVKQKRTVINTFTSEQIRIILDQPEKGTFVGVRDFTIMALLLETGVRVRELCGIKLSDINWQDGTIRIDGKGYKERLVPFQAVMRKHLARYISIRGTLDTTTLFTTVDDNPIMVRTVQDQLAFYGRKAGIKDVRCSPHTFRHTFAKMSVKNNADVFALQAVLGHATLDMVRQYVNLFSNEVRDQHRKFSPLERLF